MNKDKSNVSNEIPGEDLNELITDVYHSTESIIAYIDILGFGDLVLSLEKDSSKASTSAAFKAVTRLFQMSDFFGRENAFSPIESSIFSDTIIFSRLLDPEAKNVDLVKFFHAVGETQSAMLHFGYLTRGAISIGKCIHKKNLVLFGKAIIDAYQLEKEAKYPRVIISGSARERMENLQVMKFGNDTPEFTIPERYLRKDFDGIYFVDYLRNTANFDWKRLKETITSKLDQYRNDEPKYSKYYWLASYYNYACDVWNTRFPVEKISLERLTSTAHTTR